MTLAEAHTKNVKMAWRDMRCQELDVRPYDYRRFWNLRDDDELSLSEAIRLLEWVAEELEADYWSVVIANKGNNRVHLGWDYPDERFPDDYFENAYGDKQVGVEEVLLAIDELLEEYPEVLNA